MYVIVFRGPRQISEDIRGGSILHLLQVGPGLLAHPRVVRQRAEDGGRPVGVALQPSGYALGQPTLRSLLRLRQVAARRGGVAVQQGGVGGVEPSGEAYPFMLMPVMVAYLSPHTDSMVSWMAASSREFWR